jgi:hypothetical protein
MTMFVKGNDASTNISVSCQGIDGCVTQLQQYSTALGREQQRIDAFKGDYVNKAYQNVENFTQQLRQSLSPQSEALRNQLKTLNGALATLGVEDFVKMEDVPGEDLQKDDSEEFKGLPKIPGSVLNLIGSKMVPPLLNVAGDNFSSALTGIAKASNDLRAKESKAAQYKNALGPLATRCKKEELKQPVADLKAQADAFTGCAPTICDSDDKGADGSYQQLAVALQQITGVAGVDAVNLSLTTGMHACDSAQTKYTSDLSTLQHKLDTDKGILLAKQNVQKIVNRAPANDPCKGSDDPNCCSFGKDSNGDCNSDPKALDKSKADDDVATAQRQVDSDQADIDKAKTPPSPANCMSIADDIKSKIGKLKDTVNSFADDARPGR